MTSSVLSAARFGLVSYFCCFASSASAAQPTMQAGARINDFLYAQPRLPPAGTRRRLSFSSRDALPGQASRSRPRLASSADCRVEPRDSSLVRQPGLRGFHTYFVTHLPSSSLHPDSHGSVGPGHKLPRDASTPHIPGPGSSPAIAPFNMPGPDLTVVRIPLRRAKHHFGSFTSRGSRPYNEDADQAGIVELPAFAKRAPLSVKQKLGEPTAAESATGDPQIFYFAVFDGHGGAQCAQFLRDELHGYIEEAAAQFQLPSSLCKKKDDSGPAPLRTAAGRARGSADVEAEGRLSQAAGSRPQPGQAGSAAGADLTPDKIRNGTKTLQLQRDLVQDYRNTIGGYFKRFSPEHFGLQQGDEASASTVESCLTYAFLRADLDFVSAQARKADPDKSDIPLNHDEILGAPHATPSGHGIGGATRFKGGSTASVALISTPTPTPFWHPGAQSTLVVAHVGDSRILLCDTATGRAQPLTSDHHPSSPTESRRLRRYAPAGSMVTGDSFGESRIAGFANSRAFGDIQSKRLGVSAEPELTRVDIGPAQYSFLVLASDGVSASLSDQEIVDVVKEARTPDEGARRLVDFATEIVHHPDNATCQVVRLGGWERRSEGGLGSLGTKEVRDAHRAEALDPRRAR